MLVITHNMPLAKLVIDHISVLWQGRIIASGTLQQILDSEDP